MRTIDNGFLVKWTESVTAAGVESFETDHCVFCADGESLCATVLSALHTPPTEETTPAS